MSVLDEYLESFGYIYACLEMSRRALAGEVYNDKTYPCKKVKNWITDVNEFMDRAIIEVDYLLRAERSEASPDGDDTKQ